MKVTVKRVNESNSNAIVLPHSMIKDLHIIQERLTLKFGSWRSEVEVKSSNELPAGTIGLPNTLKLPFELPLQFQYEAKIKGRELQLGPILAFLAFKKKSDITEQSLRDYQAYFNIAPSLSGIMFICAVEGINLYKKTIEGYYFNFSAKESEQSWEFCVFPFPDVIYQTVEIKKSLYNELMTAFDQRIFNTYQFSRLDWMNWLTSHAYLRHYIPHTIPFTTIQDLDHMLSLYKTVLIKSADGLKTKKLLKVSYISGNYCFIDKSKTEHFFSEKEEAADYAENLIGKDSYLLQQSIQISDLINGSLHFKVIMQKDYSKHWSCSGILACFAHSDGATTFLTGYEALREVLKMTEREIFVKEREMIALCASASKTIEKYGGHYADAAFNILLDKNNKPWLIEVCPSYDHTIPLYTPNNKEMYFRVITTPFEYAKSLI